VLAAYVVFQIAAWRTPRFETSDIVVAMVGALIPDAGKLKLIVSSDTVETLVGVPFSWEGLSTPWGLVALAGLGSLLVTAEQRSRVFVVLLFGAFSHTVLDSMNRMPAETRFDTFDIVLDPTAPALKLLPDLYISGDYWPTILALVAAILVWTIERRR
jgi:hypothetical protein